jgi:tyrosine-specific transport protein
MPSKFTGSILIVAGTALGGGMMGLPIASASIGFFYSIGLLSIIWALMSYTALVTLEMNMYFKKGVSISYVSDLVIGKSGKYLSSVTIGVLFYTLLSAYLAGGASIFKPIFYTLLGWNISDSFLVIGFLLVFGSIVVSHAVVVDAANRLLLSVKAIFFVVFLAALSRHVNSEQLLFIPSSNVGMNLAVLIPLFFTSFGFHGSIPTLVDYLGSRTKLLRLAFLVGSLIPLIVYVLWEWVSLGAIPLTGPVSFSTIHANGDDIGFFAESLSLISRSSWVTICCQAFMVTGVITAFLGVGIGLYDWFAEQCTYSVKPGVVKTALTTVGTFGLPTVFALFYPKGFIFALGFAAIALSILAILVPAIVVYKMRKMDQYTSDYRAPGGSLGLGLAFIIGLLIIGLEMYSLIQKLIN